MFDKTKIISFYICNEKPGLKAPANVLIAICQTTKSLHSQQLTAYLMHTLHDALPLLWTWML